MKLAISDSVRQRLDDMRDALAKALGASLSSIVVHGSAVRGGWRDGSDVDVIVILRDASREKLDAIANALQLARCSARIESMILLEDQIPNSADVFPLLYRDIQRHHIVVHGADPFSDLRIADHHLRLRVEQELREAQIRLRRAVTDGLGSTDALGRVVGRKIRQVRSALVALLSLKGRATGDDLADVVKAAAELYGVDGPALLAADADPGAAHDALARLLDRAVEDIDGMQVGAQP